MTRGALAGLSLLNISLDTLRPDRFERMTRRRGHERVMAAILRAVELGFDPVKACAALPRWPCWKCCVGAAHAGSAPEVTASESRSWRGFRFLHLPVWLGAIAMITGALVQWHAAHQCCGIPFFCRMCGGKDLALQRSESAQGWAAPRT